MKITDKGNDINYIFQTSRKFLQSKQFAIYWGW